MTAQKHATAGTFPVRAGGGVEEGRERRELFSTPSVCAIRRAPLCLLRGTPSGVAPVSSAARRTTTGHCRRPARPSAILPAGTRPSPCAGGAGLPARHNGLLDIK